MPDQLPTADEAFSNLSPQDKQANSLPTADEAFGQTSAEPKTYSGPVADHFFSTGSLGQLAKTVLTAVPREVLSIADEWNQGPDSLKEFDKLPKIQEFFKGQSDWSKSINEAWMRPSIYALDTAQRAWNVLGAEVVKPVEGLANISGYTSQQFQDLKTNTQNPILRGVYGEQQYAYGVGAEMLSGVASGWLEFGHFPHPGSPLDTVIKSKSEGMIGDSGLGPDGKLPPETEAARNQATGQIVPVPQDIHGAARTLAPETFSDYDNLRAHQQTLRTTLNGLQESQAENPRFTELSAQIDNILGKVNGVEERLTDKAADRLDSLRDELRDTPKKVDSEDMAQIRHDLQVTDYKLRDLAPDVSAVYHEAAKRYGYDLYDSRKNGNLFSESFRASSEPLGSSQTASQDVPGTEVPYDQTAAREAANAAIAKANEEAASKVSPRVQSQAIFDDTVARLTAAGRPLEEAQAAGHLLQSHYEARAARFKGKLGTAEELYKKEAPDVVSFNKRLKAKGPEKVLNQEELNKPTFFSQLRKQIEAIGSKKASAKEWTNLLNNLKNRGVKQEEIDWSGLPELLYPYDETSISKQDILNHLDENAIKLSETQKHDLSPFIGEHPRYKSYNLPGAQDYRELLMTLSERTDTAKLPEGWKVVPWADWEPDEPTIQHLGAENATPYKYQVLDDKGDQRGLGNTPEEAIKDAHSGHGISPEDFKSPHWEEKNVLAHMRFDTRIDADGKKVLHIAEIQSDWHQKGRKHGYSDPEATKAAEDRLAAAEKAKKEIEDKKEALWTHWEELREKQRHAGYGHPEHDTIYNEMNETFKKWEVERDKYYPASDEYWEARRELQRTKSSEKIPDAPFKNSWHELAFKRILRYAAENNYDKVAWDTGAVSADRYSLRKQIDELHYYSDNAHKVDAKSESKYHLQGYKNGEKTVDKNYIKASDLEDVVGKEIAERIIKEEGEQHPTNESIKVLKGVDLEVGGKGMKGFYDDILPKFVNKYVKKWGAKVEASTLGDETRLITVSEGGKYIIKGGDSVIGWDGRLAKRAIPMKFDSIEEANKFINEFHPDKTNASPVHSIEVTDKMKDSVLHEGQPLFQGRRGSLTLRDNQKNLIKLFSKADASTFFHESGHQWLEELIQDSQHPEAPEDLKADAQSVRDWLGNKGEAITTKQHEQFARGFETYLMEGRAPNAELASVFQKFKEWLTKIYETIKTLNSPISDEVRGVFDRLVADPNKPDVVKDKPIDAVEDKSVDTVSEDKSGDAVEDKPTAPASRETVIAPDQKAPEERTNLDVINDTNLKATQSPPSFDSTAEVSQEQPETKHVDKAGNVRLDTLNLDTDVIESIKDLVQTNEQSKGWAKAQGKVTPQDAIDYSDTSGLSPSEVSLQKLEEVFSDTGISVSNAIKAARKMYGSVGQQIYDIAMKGEGNELDFISAIQKFARIDNVLQKASPESGRILKAWDRKAAEAAEKIQGLNEYLQGAIGKDLATIRKEMKAWELAKTAEQRAKNARNSYKSSLGQMWVEWVQNAWISGPFTHAYYIADIGLRTVEKNLFEAPVSAAIGSIQKVFSKDIDSVSWGEVGDKLYGLFDGGRKGIMAAARAAKLGVPQGIRLLDLAREKADYEVSQGTITEAERETRVKELLDNPTKDMEYKSTPSQPFIDQYKKIPGKLGSVIRAPGERMVNPLHTIGYSVNFATNLSGAISRTARLEGEAKGWTKAQVTQRMAELHYDTPTDLIQEARDAALDMSLMNKSGPYTGKLSAVLGHEFDIPILGKTPVGQIVNPFIGMVSKAIKKAVKGAAFTNPVTPFAYKDFRQSIFGADNIARQEALAKVVVGATVFSAVWSLLDQGNMNGPAPDKPTEALVSKMVYGMPNSFRVGDMSYGLDHLGSFGLRLAIIGDIHQFKGDVQTENFSKALGGLFNNLQHDILSTKAISGVSDFLEAVEHPDRFGQKYVNNFLVSGGTPFSTALNQTSTRMDDYSRRVSADGKTGVEGELQLLLEQEKSIIPKWRESLQPKVDLLGNDVPSESHWGLYASQISSDPVYQMLIQNKYFPSPVQTSIKIGGNSVQLNDEQYHEYAKKSGAGARVLLDYYLDQPFWQNASETMKHHWIQTAFSQARKEAIQSILPQPQYLDLLKTSLSMNQDFVNGVQ